MDESLKTVGGVHLSGEARDFAEKVYATLDKPPPFDLMEKVLPFHVGGDIPGGYSSDIGDVSWNVPEAGALCSTWAPGTANHSWQAAAQSGGPIGSAGALNCAKVMALSAVKLFQSPGIVKKAHEELLKRRGPTGTMSH
jgi:aminobenzoyl-glutamate utilization protein B